jgi:hypothetical protein
MTTDTGAPILDERTQAMVRTLEELLEHARQGRVTSAAIFADMPHPLEPRAHHLVVIYNAPEEEDREFVIELGLAVMEIGTVKLRAFPYTQGKYAH